MYISMIRQEYEQQHSYVSYRKLIPGTSMMDQEIARTICNLLLIVSVRSPAASPPSITACIRAPAGSGRTRASLITGIPVLYSHIVWTSTRSPAMMNCEAQLQSTLVSINSSTCKTAGPCWGQTTHVLTGLSSERDCSPKKVKHKHPRYVRSKCKF